MIGTTIGLALLPSLAWGTEAALPIGAVALGGVGALAVGFAGMVCLKLYALLKGGELGASWQTLAYALFFLSVALLVEMISSAGWLVMPSYVTAVLKLLGAVGLVVSFLRFAKVFK
jgi:hypothetical protein